jgi:hypothetical protein
MLGNYTEMVHWRYNIRKLSQTIILWSYLWSRISCVIFRGATILATAEFVVHRMLAQFVLRSSQTIAKDLSLKYNDPSDAKNQPNK